MQGFTFAEIPWGPFQGYRGIREGPDEQSSATVRDLNADSSLFNILGVFINDTYVYGSNSWGKESCG